MVQYEDEVNQLLLGFVPSVALTAALPGPGMPVGTSGKDGEEKSQ